MKSFSLASVSHIFLLGQCVCKSEIQSVVVWVYVVILTVVILNCKCYLGHRLNQIIWIIVCGTPCHSLSSPHHSLSENTSPEFISSLQLSHTTWTSLLVKSKQILLQHTSVNEFSVNVFLCLFITSTSTTPTIRSASLKNVYLFMWIWLLK